MSGGAVAYGREAQAVDASVHFADPADAQRLADAARQLRVALLAQPRTAELAEIERELAAVEDEAVGGQAADRSRLVRLRERVQLFATASAGGAAAAAFVQTVSGLLA
ncbi:hypothetical protein [Streptomyces boninensis]|uniref:hypothetical protein n=1 Tax=Streptomyces boninensis TaxID=2039455 RepID=UPI003B21516D